MNHERIYRLYRDEGLSIRSKLRNRKRAWRYRQVRPAIGGPNEVWAMDFMSDGLFDGRSFRILTIVDCHTRETLSLTLRANFRAFQVVEALDALVGFVAVRGASVQTMSRSLPDVCSTNGPTRTESRSTSLDRASRPTTPTLKPSTAACGRNT